MILYIILILIIVKITICSMVLDPSSQHSVFVSNYCPTMKHCIEGTHVMCMYYDHDHTVGQHCRNYKEITITPEMVQKILFHVNEIRTNLALGTETGKDGILLPRAYGMMKMEWDSELATLAQVLANQCLGLKEDECRATERFPNPSQVITLINFKVPDWQYLSRNATEPGLNDEKIAFAIDKALNSLHAVKRLINDETINFCPLLETLPDMGSRSYLKLIRGKATHIGCGMSAYTRYHASNNPSQNIYNSVQIVCNISDGPVQSQPLYTTTPPIPGTGFTEPCGCPAGYRESNSCLCESDSSHIETTIHPRYHHKKKHETPRLGSHLSQNRFGSYSSPNRFASQKNDKNLVLMPIFDVQDSPTSSYEPDEVEIAFHRRFGNTSFLPSSAEESDFSSETHTEIPNILNKNHKSKNRNLQNRRMFPNAHHDRKQGYKNQDTDTTSDEVKLTSEEDVNNHQNNFKQKYDDDDDDDDKVNALKENDNTFLSILELLERAVQNIDLDGDEKEIFDMKMRKIYESVIPAKTRSRISAMKPITSKIPFNIENEFLELTNYLKQKSDHVFVDETDTYTKNARNGNKLSNRDKGMSSYDSFDEEIFDPQQDNGIDDRLMDILSKKNFKGPLDRKYDKNINNAERFYDDNREFPHTSTSRKQEALVKYNTNKDLKETNSIKKGDYYNMDNYNPKNLMNIYRDRSKYTYKKSNVEKNHIMAEEKQKPRNTFNIDQGINTFARRTFSYPEHRARKAQIFNTPAYRRIFETENARPMLPIPHQETTTRTEPLGASFFISNRATI